MYKPEVCELSGLHLLVDLGLCFSSTQPVHFGTVMTQKLRLSTYSVCASARVSLCIVRQSVLVCYPVFMSQYVLGHVFLCKDEKNCGF